MQLLNFESSNQSIFHSVLPIGIGLAMVREDTNALELSFDDEEDYNETESEDEAESNLLE